MDEANLVTAKKKTIAKKDNSQTTITAKRDKAVDKKNAISLSQVSAVPIVSNDDKA